MKKLLVPALLFASFIAASQSKTLYVNIGSHNEITDANPTYGVDYNNHALYDSVKARISHLSDTLVKYGAKYNMQVESNLILACLNWDTAATNPNDFLETMENHPNIEVDPHNHMDTTAGTNYNPYNYADLDSLLQSCGLPVASAVGGFIYKQSDWTFAAYENWPMWKSAGISGHAFPSYNWKPTILWGGGTGSHVNDPYSMGVWHPAAATNQTTFMANDTSHLYCIGVGCNWVIQDTTNVTELFANFVEYINYYQSQPTTANTFYTGTVMFNFRHILKPYYLDSISKMIRLIDSYESTGEITWKTLDEKLATWQSLHTNPTDYYNLLCSSFSVGLGNYTKLSDAVYFYPNPVNDVLTIRIENSEAYEATIYDLLGEVVLKTKLGDGIKDHTINTSQIKDGSYYFVVKQGSMMRSEKLIIIH